MAEQLSVGEGRPNPRIARGLQVENIIHKFGDSQVLNGVSLDAHPGEFVTLLGPSGSGKTTLLRIIAGLVTASSGAVLISNRDVTRVAPEKRDIGLVFQNYALFPHLTAAENIAFPLKMRGIARAATRSRVIEALGLVGLSGLGSRYPAAMSGGQQQRVALARALVFQPQILLLDEPLGALDRQLRQRLGLQLRELQRELGITTIYVTHDQEEAFTLSNKVAVMDGGSILQFDAPSVIYRRPANYFVAHFVGELNDFVGDISSWRRETMTLHTSDGLEVRANSREDLSIGSTAIFGLRPERVRLVAARDREAPGTAGWPARIKTAVFGGPWVRYELIVGTRLRIVVAEGRASDELNAGEGDQVWLTYVPDDVLVFPGVEHAAERFLESTPEF